MTLRYPLFLSVLCALTSAHAQSDGHTTNLADAKASKAAFIENKGQLPSRVMFRADFGTIALFAEKDRFSWSRLQDDVGELVHEENHKRPEERVPFNIHGHAWQVKFEGANPDPMITRSGRSTARLNWFIGNDRSKWASDVHYYDEVKYASVWPGADLLLHSGPQGGFEYDVLLANAAVLPQVRFAYEGLEEMHVDREGRLVMRTSLGEQMEASPLAWYTDGAHESINCHYMLAGNVVSFAFDGTVDASRPITVDPLLIASTLSGTGDIGTTQNYGHTATYDYDGNIYTGGICFGQGYPATPGAFDLTHGGGFGVDFCISKFNEDGSDLIYATYIGGGGGDYPHSMVVTPQNELCIYGSTDSPDFPSTLGAFDETHNGEADIVVTKLNFDGTALIGSTFVGTSAIDGRNSLTWNYGDSYRGEIVCDETGRVYVASCSEGTFPTTVGAYQASNAGELDGVVFCLNYDLSEMEWGTMLGTALGDVCFGLKLDGAAGVYVCGATAASNFPTTPGAYQTAAMSGNESFIAHVTYEGSTLEQSTYFASTGDDAAFFIQLDFDNNVYIYGQCEEGSIAISPQGTYGNANADIFIAEFTPDLSTNIFKSVVGQTGGFSASCVPVAFCVDVCRHIFISGYSTLDTAFATTNDAFYTGGGFYIGVYEADMTGLLFGTYYEGAAHVDGGTSRFDPNGFVYQAVCTSGDFPTTPNAWSDTQPQGWDVGVFKIDIQQSGVQVWVEDPDESCAWAPITLSAYGNAQTYKWDFGDATSIEFGQVVQHTYQAPGLYHVKLVGEDAATCNVTDTSYYNLFVEVCTTGIPTITEAPAGLQASYSPDGDLFITLDRALSNGTLRVIAANGQLVLERQKAWSKGGNTIGAGDLAPGLYGLQLSTPDEVLTGRFLVPTR